MISGYTLAFLFFAYSFLGWAAETIVATVKGKNFANRGFVSGPFCFLYGLTSVLFALTLGELVNEPLFLFVGCAIVATAVEWFAAKLLERMHRRRWWDYSNKRWNFDGYICLQYSLLWGALGTVAMLFGNRLLTNLFLLLPPVLGHLLIWLLTPIALLDALTTLFTVFHQEKRAARLFHWSQHLSTVTLRLGTALASHVEMRIQQAYPVVRREAHPAKDPKQHIGFAKLFWLFLIASFLGDVVETIFCRVRAGVWMSRSSLVWGPFSVVWGIALVLATVLLHRDRQKPDRSIFLVGTLMGGAYEYLCSVLSELVFGTVFWDYSPIPFNLGGRINLLYCFFWGIAAVVWIKNVYPQFSRLIDWIQQHTHPMLTWLLMLFMVVNIVFSVSALSRYSQRADQIPPANTWETFIDERFDDQRMEHIYPNAIIR